MPICIRTTLTVHFTALLHFIELLQAVSLTKAMHDSCTGRHTHARIRLRFSRRHYVFLCFFLQQAAIDAKYTKANDLNALHLHPAANRKLVITGDDYGQVILYSTENKRQMKVMEMRNIPSYLHF